LADWWSLLNQAELDWSDVAFDQIFKFHEDRRSKFPDVLDEVEKANFGDVDSLMDCWVVDWDRVSNYTNSHLLAPVRPGNDYWVVDWDRVSNYTNSHLLAPVRPGNGFVVARPDQWGVH
jgi:hypothetical protein